jgi:hypothetical protein
MRLIKSQGEEAIMLMEMRLMNEANSPGQAMGLNTSLATTTGHRSGKTIRCTFKRIERQTPSGLSGMICRDRTETGHEKPPEMRTTNSGTAATDQPAKRRNGLECRENINRGWQRKRDVTNAVGNESPATNGDDEEAARNARHAAKVG